MKDRRTAQRYEMSLPIIIRALIEREIPSRIGKTRDLSSHGVYFTINDDLCTGAKMNLTMVLPAAVTGASDVFVQAVGKVVRVDERSRDRGQPIGVAAVIERYEIVRNEASKP
jgi:hypothetical protein